LAPIGAIPAEQAYMAKLWANSARFVKVEETCFKYDIIVDKIMLCLRQLPEPVGEQSAPGCQFSVQRKAVQKSDHRK
jgi:hypothetical protein